MANYIDVDGYVVHENVEADVTKMHNSLLSEKKEKWFTKNCFVFHEH